MLSEYKKRISGEVTSNGTIILIASCPSDDSEWVFAHWDANIELIVAGLQQECTCLKLWINKYNSSRQLHVQSQL